MALEPPGVILPPIRQRPSPNHSTRRGVVPHLIVVHRPAGTYLGSIAHLCNPAPGGDPRDAVSAHAITDSSRELTQLVPWDRKAWACATFNAPSYNLEVDDDAWNGSDPAALLSAARVVAFLCKRTGIPPRWSSDPLSTPGVIRHLDLGAAGGSHADPTTDRELWRRFVARVAAEHNRGEFRPVYGIGTLHRIDT